MFIGQRQAGNLKFFCQDNKDQAEGQRSSVLKVTSQTFCILPNLITINICLVLNLRSQMGPLIQCYVVYLQTKDNSFLTYFSEITDQIVVFHRL